MSASRTTDDLTRSAFGCGLAAGPRALLGLGGGAIDADMVAAARRSGQAKIDALEIDDAARGELGRVLDAAVRALAGEVAATPAPKIKVDAGGSPESPLRPKAPSQVTASQLTPFDRQILSILVSGGGWNGRTRVLIAGLSQRVGVNAATLRKVVIGLAGFMRNQGVAGTLGEISRDTPVVKVAGLETEVDPDVDATRPGGVGDTRLATVLVLFVLLAVFFGVVLIQVLTAPSPVVRRQEARRLEVEAAMARADQSSKAGVGDAYVVTDSIREGRARPRRFARVPDLKGRSAASAILAASRVPDLMDGLEAIERKLRLRPDALPEGDELVWREAVAALADCWPILGETRRRESLSTLNRVLAVANDASVGRRLFGAADAIAIDDSLAPQEIWRRPFQAGWLATMVGDADLPPVVRERARDILGGSLLDAIDRVPDGRGFVFDRAALAMLDRLVPDLVASVGVLPPDDESAAWERWFEAQRELRRDRERQAAMLAVVDALLEQNRGLATDGRPLDLLGRVVLRELDWSSGGPAPEGLAEAYAVWSGSEKVDDEAFWVLASLLVGPAGLGWYEADFVPDPDLGSTERARRLGATLAAWPKAVRLSVEGELRAVNAALLDRLQSLERRIEADLDLATTSTDRMVALLAAERAALAAVCLAEGREVEAEAIIGTLIEQVERGRLDIDLDRGSGIAVRANDGAWASAFDAARRNRTDRLELVQVLGSEVANDLGPRDAAALALAVWSDPDEEIRRLAKDVVLRNFSHGPTTSLALLDTIGRAGKSESATRFIEAIADVELPSRRDPDSISRRRLALARHVAGLNRDGGADRRLIEWLTDEITDVTSRRAGLRSMAQETSGVRRPDAAASAAAVANRDVASSLFLAIDTTRTLREIDARWRARESLAEDGIQRTVASHLAELEFLAFMLQARLPSRAAAIGGDVARLQAAIVASADGIDQAARAALAISELERRPLVPDRGSMEDSG